MQDVIEGVVRLVGWTVLKGVTLGRYKSPGESGLLAEGAIGLLAIAGVLWVAYNWWPA